MRLKANYPIASLSPAAQVVAKALQKYGMLMADGGNIALTAQNDTLSTVKWADVGFDANSLSALKATDFEVIDYGTPTDVTFNCTRTQIIEP
jgi:serine/threonine-protein kinase